MAIPTQRIVGPAQSELAQFLDETWLDLVRAYRPDLARGRSARETLDLRREPKLAREITMRFVERNIAILRQRGLPVTAGTLYLRGGRPQLRFFGQIEAPLQFAPSEHQNEDEATCQCYRQTRSRLQSFLYAIYTVRSMWPKAGGSLLSQKMKIREETTGFGTTTTQNHWNFCPGRRYGGVFRVKLPRYFVSCGRCVADHTSSGGSVARGLRQVVRTAPSPNISTRSCS